MKGLGFPPRRSMYGAGPTGPECRLPLSELGDSVIAVSVTGLGVMATESGSSESIVNVSIWSIPIFSELTIGITQFRVCLIISSPVYVALPAQLSFSVLGLLNFLFCIVQVETCLAAHIVCLIVQQLTPTSKSTSMAINQSRRSQIILLNSTYTTICLPKCHRRRRHIGSCLQLSLAERRQR